MGENLRTPGWYGKLPALGDFASRRLPPPFIAQWDGWLQQAMAGSRAALGERWLEGYLTSPVWHFLLGPGVAGERPWAGVMMPSVDKVGRYFPLTLCSEVRRPPDSGPQMNTVLDWLENLEHAALATLDVERNAQALEDALSALPFPEWCPTDDVAASLAPRLAGSLGAGSPSVFSLDGYDNLLPLLGATAVVLLQAALQRRSLWWSGTTAAGQATLFCADGLPAVHQFTRMLSWGAAAGEQ